MYVVTAPAGDPDDLSLRAQRTLETASLIVADDLSSAQPLLDHHGIVAIAAPVAGTGHLDALAEGDVAYLLSGLSPALSEAGYRLVHEALRLQVPVVPVPGPSFPITALVLSGLPADGFVYLGELPEESVARGELLAAVSLEPRTLLALVPHALLPLVLADLYHALGDRPLVQVAPSATGADLLWRGRLGQSTAVPDRVAFAGARVLVIGGAPVGTLRWDEDQLCARVQSLQAEGLGAKKISQQLAGASGWPRRQIYRLAVELAQGGTTDAS